MTAIVQAFSQLDDAIFTVFSAASARIGIIALVVAMLAFVLAAARDAYEMDPVSIPPIVSPIGGPTYARPSWRYLSDQAQWCREWLPYVAWLMRGFVQTALSVLALGTMLKIAAEFMKWNSFDPLSWMSVVLIWLALGFGFPTIWLVGAIAYRLTQARADPLANKA